MENKKDVMKLLYKLKQIEKNKSILENQKRLVASAKEQLKNYNNSETSWTKRMSITNVDDCLDNLSDLVQKSLKTCEENYKKETNLVNKFALRTKANNTFNLLNDVKEARVLSEKMLINEHFDSHDSELIA